MSLKTVAPWYLSMTSKTGQELLKGTQVPLAVLPLKILGALVVLLLLIPIHLNLRPFYKPIFILILYAVATKIYLVLSTVVGLAASFIKAPVPKAATSVVAYLLYLQDKHSPPKEKAAPKPDDVRTRKAKEALMVLYNILKEEFQKLMQTTLTKEELGNAFKENIKPKLPHPFNITASAVVILMLILKVAFKTEGMLIRAPYEIMKMRKAKKG